MPAEELELAMNYYKRQADELAGLNVKADSIISAMKHQLRQQQQGFSLLSQLQQSIGTQMEQSEIFTRTIKAINTTLNMDCTIVFTAIENSFKPSYWLGCDAQVAQSSDRFRLNQNDSPLVNRSTEKTEFTKQLQAVLQVPYFVGLPIVTGGESGSQSKRTKSTARK